MLNLTKTQKSFIQYGFLLFLICITVYLVSTTLDISLIPMIIKISILHILVKYTSQFDKYI